MNHKSSIESVSAADKLPIENQKINPPPSPKQSNIKYKQISMNSRKKITYIPSTASKRNNHSKINYCIYPHSNMRNLKESPKKITINTILILPPSLTPVPAKILVTTSVIPQN